jgi:hypothetical protein
MDNEAKQQNTNSKMSPILQYFTYKHLPETLQEISKPFCELAQQMAEMPPSAEISAGLRKLLEAKDCFVRAALSK